MRKNNNYSRNEVPPVQKGKKPFYKKKWFIIIFILFILFGFIGSLNGNVESSTSSERETNSENEKLTDAELEKIYEEVQSKRTKEDAKGQLEYRLKVLPCSKQTAILDLEDYLYTEEQIQYAIKDIDWEEQAINFVEKAKIGPPVLPASKIEPLLKEEGFTNEEITSAMKLVDSKEQVMLYIESYIGGRNPVQIQRNMKDAGFNEEEIELAIEMMAE